MKPTILRYTAVAVVAAVLLGGVYYLYAKGRGSVPEAPEAEQPRQ